MTVYRTTIKTKALNLFLFSLLLSFPALATEPNTPITEETEAELVLTREELQSRLLTALSGEFSNFYALTEHPTTVGDFSPIIQQADIVTLANGEQAILIEQRFLETRAARSQVQLNNRRQLYTFVTPRKSEELVQITYPVPANITAQFLSEPEALQQLKRLPGCEIHWQHEQLNNGESSFEGYRNPKRCFFIDSSDNSPIHMESILHVANHEIKMTDNLLDANGEPLSEMELAGTLILNPIRFFDMTVSFLPEGANKDNDEAWINIQPEGLIHDHGQRINLRTQKEQQTIPYQIKLVREEGTTNKLQVRIYSLGSETPLEELTVELENGVGVLNADPLRVELQVR